MDWKRSNTCSEPRRQSVTWLTTELDEEPSGRHTVKVPTRKTPNSMSLFFTGSVMLNSSGSGIAKSIRSDEMLMTAFVIR